MICIYHSKDLDGYCSGAIVKHKYPDAKLIGFDYGQKLPMDLIPENEPIIMIDVSLPMPEMEALAKHSGWKLTWIDHHISAINDYKAFTNEGEGFLLPVLENGISACEGGWKYLFPNTEMPRAVRLLGEYDTWRNQDKHYWNNTVMPFQYGMRMECGSPETFNAQLFNEDGRQNLTDDIIRDGKLILSYQNSQYERAAKASFEIEFEGLRAVCLNAGGGNSQMFASVFDENKHDIMIPFFFGGKRWTFSLYTTKDEIDCSVIAKSKGGGGHKKAAGFTMPELPAEFKVHVEQK